MNKELIENVKESTVLVGISAGLGFIAKKVLKKSVTNDPSSSIMNFVQWVGVVCVSIFVRDYLINQKILPD